jgi:tRNA pseudouridine55 synthase
MTAGPNEWNGLLVLDKPGGMTSRDAINRMQRQLPRGTKIGHTGTLDPLATGVLVVCLGQATRLAEYVQAMSKTYRSTFLLGSRSDTDDADGVISPVEGARPVSLSEVNAALQQFIGDLDQTPPKYSAAKVSGDRAYDLARAGEAVDLKPRRVKVYQIEVHSCSWPNMEVEIQCGKGTYIRSLARDFGEKLDCGALVAALRRTRVGPFRAEDALSVDADLATIRAHLRPIDEAVSEMPRIEIPVALAVRLGHGQIVPVNTEADGQIAVFADGQLVAVALVEQRYLRPLKVLVQA